MKRYVLLLVLFVCAGAMLSAGIFFQPEVSGGLPSTTYKYDMGYTQEYDYSAFGFDFGAKVGYGPIADIPLYLIAEASWGAGTTVKNNYYDTFFNRYSYSWPYEYYYFDTYDIDRSYKSNHIYLGGGAVFYPIERLQVAATAGLTGTILEYKEDGYIDSWYNLYYYGNWYGSYTSRYDEAKYDKTGAGVGFSFKSSIAWDFGGDSNGLVAGIKFAMLGSSDIELASTKFDVNTTYIGAFIGWRFGEKRGGSSGTYDYYTY